MTDRILSVSAIVTAIAAVLVAAYEARINREYQRISVWPRIQQSNSFVVGEPYLRIVSNVGVGPALIRSVQVSVDGVPRRRGPKAQACKPRATPWEPSPFRALALKGRPMQDRF